jgi:GT2 family glycosyltransferase
VTRHPNIVSWFQIGGTGDQEPREQPAELVAGCTVAICTFGRAGSVHRFLNSLSTQTARPQLLVIVDASLDADTEQMLRMRDDLGKLATTVLYVRVTGALRGLTRQRNFALRWVTTDLVAFFDDDIVLHPDCLAELERVHRRHGETVVGVAALLANQATKPTLMARLSLLLGVVSTLRAGSYCRSGFAVPWEFSTDDGEFIAGEWLYATATMWKTRVATRVLFYDGFSGYSLGEDLEFSLRARQHGMIGVASRALVLHLHDAASRPNPFTLGYMEIVNRFEIQRRGLADRTRLDVLWFAYAWAVDTILLTRDLRIRTRQRSTISRLCGRFKGAYDVTRGLHSSPAI